MKKLLLFAFFLILLHQFAAAQDKHFTQFYAAPLTLNPALTGAFEGRYRVSIIYRDQWKKVLDNPFKTFALAADLRFPARGRSNSKDALGLGLLFFNDKTGVIDFSTTQIAVSLAYHKSLGVDDRQFLSAGLQGGITQRNVNYASLTFHDQFDGSTGYTMGTGEDLPANNFSFTDYNVGLNYTAEFGRSGRFYAGLALHHFLQPKISFYENSGKGDKLYRKASGQVSANIPLNPSGRVSLEPRFLVAAQGPHLEINAGTNFRVVLNQYGGNAIHFGTWVRPVRNDDGIGLDAVVALVGLELNNV
ncbi:MAG: PorP/SprF family type IX secretion system membrane protein, partial [Saprospiraceae bacterium]